MDDILGMAQIAKNDDASAGCVKMGSGDVTTGWACDNVKCPSYGGYCPFS